MRLILVYNADAGLFNALTDTAHKLLSPQTYDCRLCALTYGAFSMRTAWKDFLDDLGLPLAFYHRDEFERGTGRSDVDLPAVLIEDEGTLSVLVPAAEIDACDDLDDLMAAVEAALRERRAPS
ncbi:MAG: hypothetical protein GVY18_01905 [Bacteroidetes bacterium]|jgi:hypothetical protein|nr:hypothetical protein [Bacteroidota bacterium]